MKNSWGQSPFKHLFPVRFSQKEVITSNIFYVWQHRCLFSINQFNFCFLFFWYCFERQQWPFLVTRSACFHRKWHYLWRSCSLRPATGCLQNLAVIWLARVTATTTKQEYKYQQHAMLWLNLFCLKNFQGFKVAIISQWIPRLFCR